MIFDSDQQQLEDEAARVLHDELSLQAAALADADDAEADAAEVAVQIERLEQKHPELVPDPEQARLEAKRETEAGFVRLRLARDIGMVSDSDAAPGLAFWEERRAELEQPDLPPGRAGRSG